MKSPMHEALKNHMAKAKVSASPLPSKGEPIKKAQDENLGDAAPSVDGPKPPVGMETPELGEEHLGLLDKLSSGVEHPGRGAMTLDERAGDKMKERMASINKKKHSL